MATLAEALDRMEPVTAPRHDHPLGDKMFTPGEIEAIRSGVDGIKSSIPARCYYDEDVYRFEVEHILKKNWLCVGRWDWAKNPGDYYTRRMFGESIIIVRDKKGELHALLNACRHRWSQLVPEGSGHAKLLVCPYHSWTYELNGALRGVSVSELPGLDKKKCNLHSLRIETWLGFVFVNFDPDAAPLNPQLEGLTSLVKEYGIETFESAGDATYDTTWNYKFSFETGYEAYHHEGVHKSLLAGTARFHQPHRFGKLWGTYMGTYEHGKREPFPFGSPPWMTKESREYPPYMSGSLFAAVYPNLIMVLNPHRTLAIVTEHLGVDHNRASTFMTIAPWARERDPDKVEASVQSMKVVQSQDTDGCRMLQAGVTSRYNQDSFIHPLEGQLSHYYNWYLDQYLAAGSAQG